MHNKHLTANKYIRGDIMKKEDKIIAGTDDSLEKLKYSRLYRTYALADTAEVDPANNVSKPSVDNVAEAREFVDRNEK